MNREIHVRFWEGVGVRLPCATQLFGFGVHRLSMNFRLASIELIPYDRSA